MPIDRGPVMAMPVEEVSSPEDLHAFYKALFIAHGESEREAEEDADWNVKNRQRVASNNRFFVIRDENGSIIAGGELRIDDHAGQKEAYGGQKFVAPELRNQNIAAMLDAKGLEVAKQAGCTQVWGVVGMNSGAALRSAFKGGIVLRGVRNEETGQEDNPDCYYVSRSLVEAAGGPKTVTPADLVEAQRIRTINELQSPKAVLAPWADHALVVEILKRGYVGKWLALPKDDPSITEPMIYFEKV